MRRYKTMQLYLKITDGGAMYLCSKPVENTNVGDLKYIVTRIDGEHSDNIYQALKDANSQEEAEEKWVDGGWDNEEETDFQNEEITLTEQVKEI